MNKFILSTIAALVFPALVLADTQTASVATNLGLYGGKASSLAIAPDSSAMYMTTLAPNGLFRSTDGGDSWTGLPADVNYGNGESVVVDPATGNVYALVGDSVLKSSDQGVTWNDISNNSDTGFGNVMAWGSGRLLVTGNSGEVQISDDNGSTFTQATIQSGNAQVTWLNDSPTVDTYYAVLHDTTSDSLYKSVDGGSTWTNLLVTDHGVTAGDQFSEVGVDPNDPNDIVIVSVVPGDPSYHTTDGGTNWTALMQDGSKVNGGFVSFDGAGRMYMGQNYTADPTDATPTWTMYTTTTPLSSIYADLFAVDPNDTNILYTNSSMGLAKSSDRAVSWVDEISGVTSVAVYDISQATDKDIVWIGADGGLAKSTNFTSSAPTWQYPILPAQGVSMLQAVWVQPDNADHVVAGLSGFISYTTDGGTTWSNSVAPSFSGRMLDIQQSRVDSATLYAISEYDNLAGSDVGSVLMSTDNGVNWTSLSLPDDMPAIAFTVASDDTLYVGVGGDAANPGVYQYTSGVWTELSGGSEGKVVSGIVIDPTDDNKLFVSVMGVGTGTGFYTSADAGASWEVVVAGLDNANNLGALSIQSSTTPNTLYLAGQDSSSLNGTIYKSSDNGATWAVYYTGLKQETFHSLFFDGLVAGNDRGLFNVKSRATLHLSKPNHTTLKAKLRDAATGKVLKNQTIKFYKRVNGSWKFVDKVKTNSHGKASLTIPATSTKTYKAKWKPNSSTSAEYTSAHSSTVS